MSVCVTRVNFDAHGLKRVHAQQRLCVRFAKYNRSADDLSHELDVLGCYVEPHFAAVSQAIYALSLWFETDRL